MLLFYFCEQVSRDSSLQINLCKWLSWLFCKDQFVSDFTKLECGHFLFPNELLSCRSRIGGYCSNDLSSLILGTSEEDEVFQPGFISPRLVCFLNEMFYLI